MDRKTKTIDSKYAYIDKNAKYMMRTNIKNKLKSVTIKFVNFD